MLTLNETQMNDTVLVIDDTADSLRFLTDTLEGAGMTVLVSKSAETAFVLLGKILPNIILMDAIMPGLNGFEATRHIKANPAWAHIPIIFMTGLSEPEHVVEALEAGGVDYVRKPIVITELLARLQVHLNNARVSHSSQVALDASGRHLVAVNASGEVLWVTPQALGLLQEIDPGWSADAGQLPGLLSGGISALLADGFEEGASRKTTLADKVIELTNVSRTAQGEYYIRLEELNEDKDVERLRARHGLTQREAEVLLWISYGKTNRGISDILSISPRTVNKHLEQVFEKLGVETRAAAAAFAVRTTMS